MCARHLSPRPSPTTVAVATGSPASSARRWPESCAGWRQRAKYGRVSLGMVCGTRAVLNSQRQDVPTPSSWRSSATPPTVRPRFTGAWPVARSWVMWVSSWSMTAFAVARCTARPRIIAGAPAPTVRNLPACHIDVAFSALSAGPVPHSVLARWPRGECDRPAHLPFLGRDVLADQASRERANQEFLEEKVARFPPIIGGRRNG